MNLLDQTLDTTEVLLGEPAKARPLFKTLPDGALHLEIDWSSFEGFLNCQRIGKYRNVQGRIALPKSALVYGQAIHSALEHRYRHGFTKSQPLYDSPDWKTPAINILLKNPFPAGEWRGVDVALQLLNAYEKQYSHEPFEIFHVEDNAYETSPAVELSFSVPLMSTELPGGTVHVSWTGVIDLIVIQNDEVWVVDHKTSSIQGPSVLTGFQLSQQMHGYKWAVEKLIGKPVAGVIINSLITRKPSKNGTPIDFERNWIPIRRDQTLEWEEDIKNSVVEFLHCLETDTWRMNSSYCVGKFGKCQYHDVCMLPRNQRDTMLNSSAFVNCTWNPLGEGES